MQYTTLTYNGTERSLADWNISAWRREAYNSASDAFAFDLQAPADAADPFPFGSRIVIKFGRLPASGPSTQPNGLPLSGVTSWQGGSTAFVGYRVDSVRLASGELEQFSCKFAGPWDFFLERLVYKQLWLGWNGSAKVADYRSQVVLGLGITNVTATGAISGTAPQLNLLTLAQTLIQIVQYAASVSSYEQTVNGLGWPSGAQFQFDNLSTDSGGNFQLALSRANCKIPDFVPGFAGASGDIAAATTGILLRAPLDAVNDLTCAECLRRLLRWIGAVGSPVCWWDYSTSPPTLKVSTRDQLTAVTLPAVGGSVRDFKLKRRDDLVPPAIAYKYRVAGQINSQPYTTLYNDIAAAIDGAPCEGIGYTGLLTALGGGALTSGQQNGLPLQANRPGAVMATLDFEGYSANTVGAAIVTAPLNTADPAGGGAAAAFWKALFPELAQTSGLAFFNSGNPGVSMIDNNGAPINSASYPALYANGGPYVLLEGQVAPWMYVNNTPASNTPGACVEAAIAAQFAYVEAVTPPSGGSSVPTGAVASHPKTVRVKLTNLSSGSYYSRPQVANPGEPIPFGLAGYVYAIESILQYEGTVTLQEQEISDACPLGNALNLSASLAEWASMNACVQSVSYDDSGRTTISVGPAKHLGPGDIVERLRANRGPRWLYLIGNDVLAQDPQTGPAELGQYLPKQSPSPGNKVANWHVVPSNLEDWQSNPAAYPLPPGVTLYGAGANPSSATFTGIGGGPGVALAGGSGGSPGGISIKCDLAQAISALASHLSSGAIQFYEMNTCEGGDSTLYRIFLCSPSYHKS